MTGIQERLTTGKGKFAPLYPELGTGPVSYEDSISQEFFDAEREAVFRRSWLKIGRMEGRALLDRLLDWATRPEFVLRHQWSRDDLVIWDNTGLLPRALPYSEASARLMHRTSLASEEAAA